MTLFMLRRVRNCRRYYYYYYYQTPAWPGWPAGQAGPKNFLNKTGWAGSILNTCWLYFDQMYQLLGERAVKPLSDTCQTLLHSTSTASVSNLSSCSHCVILTMNGKVIIAYAFINDFLLCLWSRCTQ